MLRWFTADLHIHTVLSACAELTMGPKDIVEAALKRKIDIIAITDHNTAGNVKAVMDVAATSPVTVIPGIEVSTKEGIHLIALFSELHHLLSFEEFVFSVLQQGFYDEELYGPQLRVDEEERIIEYSKKLFFFNLKVSLQEIVGQALKHQGIIYPAHIDRKAYSLFNHYDVFPAELPFHTAEISNPDRLPNIEHRFDRIDNLRLITASDAHDIKDVGKKPVCLKLKNPCFEEIAMALTEQSDRCIKLPGLVSSRSACCV